MPGASCEVVLNPPAAAVRATWTTSTGILEMNRELNNIRLKISPLVYFNTGFNILKVPECPMFASCSDLTLSGPNNIFSCFVGHIYNTIFRA